MPSRSEKRGGTHHVGRAQLDLALEVVVRHDTLVVTRLDRLGRSRRDLADIAHEIEHAGAQLPVSEQNLDTATSAGRAIFGMPAVLAQCETDVRRARRSEGIAPANTDVAYTGGKSRSDRDRVVALTSAGNGPATVARSLGVSRISVYRILREIKVSGQS